MKSHSGSRILCLGEVSWDRVSVLSRMPRPEGDCHLELEQEDMGGCALNSAVVLGALQVPVDLAGNWLGRDMPGRVINSKLRALSVRSYLQAHPKFATPRCQCLVEQGTGHRQFILEHSSIQKASPQLWLKAGRLAREGVYSQIFLQAYLSDLSRGFFKVAGPLEGTWILSQDLDSGSPFVPRIDAIQISAPENRPWNLKALEKVARPYFRGRLTEVFITGGARGIAWQKKGQPPRLFQATRAKHVRDTTGCGDTFRAGLMLGIHLGQSRPSAIKLGMRLAARKAEQWGSYLKLLKL